jgi:hypothetical protein
MFRDYMTLNLGKIAYDAYFKYSEGKSLISGQPLPTWENQDSRIQQAWQAAGQNVIDAVIANLISGA